MAIIIGCLLLLPFLKLQTTADDNQRIFHQIRYKNCKSQFELIRVGVLDCNQADRCEFERGKEYQIQIGFKPNRHVDHLKTAVWSHLGDAHGALTKFHMENDNACISSNITCPLEPDQIYWYTQSVFIMPEYPDVDVQVNWLLTNPDAPRNAQGLPTRREVCVKFLAKVIDAGSDK